MKSSNWVALGFGVIAGVLVLAKDSRAQQRPLPFPLTAASDPFYQISSIDVQMEPKTEPTLKDTVLTALGKEFREGFKQQSRLEGRGVLEQIQVENPLGIAEVAMKVWDIIEANKAVLNVSRTNVKALPNAAKYDWTSLTGWKPEHGIEFSMSIKNLYGMEVIRLVYDVDAIYGGSVRGQGKYIASARVVPKDLNVLWGFSMDVNVAEVSVQNLGTTKDPLAAITLDVGVTYGSLLNKTSFTNSYQILGNGTITDIKSGSRYFGAP